MLAKESNEDVISEAIAALGYIYNPAAAPLIAPFADHSNPEIRYSVAHSLGHFADESASILGLTKLIDDPDKEVRDWAIFGIGTQGNADSEDLRLRFIAHLDDPYFDARQEAAGALAKRHDIRVVAPLISMLKRYGDIVCLCEAARDLLHIEDRPIDWYATEYVAALEAAFPEQATNTANPPL